MSWAYEFAPTAKRKLDKLPQPIKKRLARVLKNMEADPFRGNIESLSGPEWRGVFRRRMGSYRLLFTVDYSKKIIFIAHIAIRSEKTYR